MPKLPRLGRSLSYRLGIAEWLHGKQVGRFSAMRLGLPARLGGIAKPRRDLALQAGGGALPGPIAGGVQYLLFLRSRARWRRGRVAFARRGGRFSRGGGGGAAWFPAAWCGRLFVRWRLAD